jgi:predicted Rossmann-fold nucleotide-binding protein
MGAASRGARSKGGEVLGYTVTSWDGLPANEAVTRRIDSADLFDRLRLFSEADLLIGLDGGIGTLAEIAVAWNLLQVSDARPLLLVGDAWVELVDFVRRRLVVGPADLEVVHVLPSGTPASMVLAEAQLLMGARLGLGAPWEASRNAPSSAER